jgi:hypothetical protein
MAVVRRWFRRLADESAREIAHLHTEQTNTATGCHSLKNDRQ